MSNFPAAALYHYRVFSLTDAGAVRLQLWTSVDQPDSMFGVFPRAMRGLHDTSAEEMKEVWEISLFLAMGSQEN